MNSKFSWSNAMSRRWLTRTGEIELLDGLSVEPREFDNRLAKLREVVSKNLMFKSTINDMRREIAANVKHISDDDIVLIFSIIMKDGRS